MYHNTSRAATLGMILLSLGLACEVNDPTLRIQIVRSDAPTICCYRIRPPRDLRAEDATTNNGGGNGGGDIEAAESIYVTFDEVSAHLSGGGNTDLEDDEAEGSWIVISDAIQTVDLLGLESGAEVLGLAELAEGHYSQLRLHILDAAIVIGGETYPMTIPSGSASGLKIKSDLDLVADTATTVTLGFDVADSVSWNNGQGYMMSPVIELLLVESTPGDQPPTPPEDLPPRPTPPDGGWWPGTDPTPSPTPIPWDPSEVEVTVYPTAPRGGSSPTPSVEESPTPSDGSPSP